MTSCTDEQFMGAALEEARKAHALQEVPVGAVLVLDHEIIARGHNSTIALHDPTAHAEIVALRRAGSKLGNYRLVGAELFVTVEPCIMCMGALIHARIERLVFGAADHKSGAAVSRYRIGSDNLLNHTLNIEGGLLENECASLLKSFFQNRRV